MGFKGEACLALQAKLKKTAELKVQTIVPLEVRLVISKQSSLKTFSPAPVVLLVSWCQVAEEQQPSIEQIMVRQINTCVDELEAFVRETMVQLYDRIIGERQARRESMRLCFEKRCREYHEALEAERVARRQARGIDRASRGLELPPQREAVEGSSLRLRQKWYKCSGSVKVRRRKDRTRAQKEKRKRMLHAWAALNDMKVTSNARRHHSRRVRSDAQRLLKYDAALRSGASASKALEHIEACAVAHHVEAPSMQKRRVARRGQRGEKHSRQGRREEAARLLKDMSSWISGHD